MVIVIDCAYIDSDQADVSFSKQAGPIVPVDLVA